MALPEAGFPFELGWVFAAAHARGGKSMALCAALLRTAAEGGVFATTAIQNGPMQKTLAGLGFKRVGNEWPSAEGDETLCLFTLAGAERSPATPGAGAP